MNPYQPVNDSQTSKQATQERELFGRCVEVGDDDEGQPRLIIHTTREQLMRFGRNLAYSDVVVTLTAGHRRAEPPAN
jgi:hypothetical protein